MLFIHEITYVLSIYYTYLRMPHPQVDNHRCYSGSPLHSASQPPTNTVLHTKVLKRKRNVVSGLSFLSDTKASEKFSKLVLNTRLCKDISKLSPICQTSSLEAFHNLIIQFAPKCFAFSYLGMQCR